MREIIFQPPLFLFKIQKGAAMEEDNTAQLNDENSECDNFKIIFKIIFVHTDSVIL